MTEIDKARLFVLAVSDISAERGRQDEQWGVQEHPHFKWLTILMEEVGEACEASLNNNALALRHELVQVAAVAVAAIECIDRGRVNSHD